MKNIIIRTIFSFVLGYVLVFPIMNLIENLLWQIEDLVPVSDIFLTVLGLFILLLLVCGVLYVCKTNSHSRLSFILYVSAFFAGALIVYPSSESETLVYKLGFIGTLLIITTIFYATFQKYIPSYEIKPTSGTGARNRNTILLLLIPVLFIVGSFLIIANESNHVDVTSINAKTKATLNSAQAEAELYYVSTEPNTYAGFCDHYFDMLDTRVAQLNITCNDTATSYVIGAPLTNNQGYFCVDNYGPNVYTQDMITTSTVSCAELAQ
jgi:hypothetical protein